MRQNKLPTDERLTPLLSKVYEKNVNKQINLFLETKLSHHLCGLCSKYSTQYALSNLINLQKCLDKSGLVGTIRIYASKAFDCPPHDLIIVKMHAYGV